MAGRVQITLTVNGVAHTLSVAPLARLLDVLRDDLGLTGTKEGCGEGECGACSVFLDGLLVNSCLVPAAQADGVAVTTIEGLAETQELDELQAAMLRHGGTQCGFCAPGMVLAAIDLRRRVPHPSRVEAIDALSGNLCRCTGYAKILAAVLSAEDAT